MSETKKKQMSATSPYPIGGTQQQIFSANPADVNNVAFIDQIATGMQSKDTIVRKSIQTNLGINCKPLLFLESYLGYETYCPERTDDTWKVARFFPTSKILPYASTTATTIANGASVTLTLPADRQLATLGNILPQPNEYILIADVAYLKVTSVSNVIGTPTITVQNNTGASVTIGASGNFIAISGVSKLRCTCPTQKGKLPGKPLLEDYKFWSHWNKIDICSKDLETCLRFEYDYLLWNEKTQQFDKVTNVGSQLIKTTFADYEKDKEYKIMYHNENGNKGIEPQLRGKAILWNLNNPVEITDADMDVLDDLISSKNLGVKEFTIMARKGLYRAAQKYMRDTAQGKFVFGCFDVDDMCKTVDIDLCAIERNGVKIKFILDECSSSGQHIGALTSPNSTFKGIGMPMQHLSGNGSSRAGSTSRVATIVYERGNDGTVYNSLYDSTGKHGMRQIQGAGCEINEYSMDSRLAVEIQDPFSWILVNY